MFCIVENGSSRKPTRPANYSTRQTTRARADDCEQNFSSEWHPLTDGLSGGTPDASAWPGWLSSSARVPAERAAARSRVCEMLTGRIEHRAAVEQRLQGRHHVPADTPRGQGSTRLGRVGAGEAQGSSQNHILVPRGTEGQGLPKSCPKGNLVKVKERAFCY